MKRLRWGVTVGRFDRHRNPVALALFNSPRIARAYAVAGSRQHATVTFYVAHTGTQHSVGVTEFYLNGESYS